MEKAGASLAVIIDDNDREDIKNVIMSDDGTGTGIRIPSMIIGSRDGKALIDFLQKNEELAKKASLTAEFVMENPDNRVEWSLWYTSISDKALDFIRNFKTYHKKFHPDDTQFEPRIVTWSCPNCDSEIK